MRESKNKVQLHIIRSDVEVQTEVARHLSYFVPRVGDEIRLREGEFYTVTLVVWCFDEPDHPFTRVNIGAELINT